MHPGVYYISGAIAVPTQVIVTSRLPKGKYEAFKVLSKNADKGDVLKLLGMIETGSNERVAEYISSVLHVSIAVNEELFSEIKEAGIMIEAVERVFKKEMEDKKAEGKEEVVEKMLLGNMNGYIFHKLR